MQNITLAEVASAIANLTAAGQKPTLNAIRATLGDRGSASTILKFKRQLDNGNPPDVADSAPGLEEFRKLWALAIAAGRSERDLETLDLKETIDALGADNERIEAEATGLRSRLFDMEFQRNQLITDLTKAQHDLTSLQADGQQHASRIAELNGEIVKMQREQQSALNAARATHTQERDALTRQWNEAKERAHSAILASATLKAELKAAQAETAEQGLQAARAREETAEARKQLNALMLTLAAAAQRPAQDGTPPSRSAASAAGKPSPLGATTARKPKPKGKRSHPDADKKPGHSTATDAR